MAANPFTDTPDAVAAEVQLPRRGQRRKKRVDKLGSTEPKPKKTDLNPKQRAWFERNGFTYYRTEKPNPWGAVTQDQWGCIDYLCSKPGFGIMLVQVTSATNISSHFAKIKKAPEIPEWLKAGGLVEIHAWWKVGGRWQVRRVRIELDGDTLIRKDVSE